MKNPGIPNFSRTCDPVTIVALMFVPVSKIPKPASVDSLLESRERIAKVPMKLRSLNYLHLAAFAASCRPGSNHLQLVDMHNRRLTGSLTSYILNE